MTAEMVVRSPREIEAVNSDPAARIIREGLEKSWMSQVTAIASSAIAVPSGAWDWSLPERKTIELEYEPGLFNLSVTGVHDEAWTGRDTRGGEHAIVVDPAVGTGAFIAAAFSALLFKRFDAVNVNAVIATRPEEDYVEGLLLANVDRLTEYRSMLGEVERARESALGDVRRRLDRRRASYAQRAPRDVAIELADDLGVGQLVIARALGVTPTAVRKWRRGDPARTEHRDRLARFAALVSVLGDFGLHDPASWVDIPVSTASTLRPLDLFVSGRSDLIVLLAADLIDPEDALDEFSPDWRESFAPDTDYEVVRLSDGSRSVVPRMGDRSDR